MFYLFSLFFPPTKQAQQCSLWAGTGTERRDKRVAKEMHLEARKGHHSPWSRGRRKQYWVQYELSLSANSSMCQKYLNP